MLLRSALVFLAFFVLIGACTSEEVTREGSAEPTVEGEVASERSATGTGQATPDESVEPTVKGEIAPEQPETGTGQAVQEGHIGPRLGDRIISLCTPPIPQDPTDEPPLDRGSWREEDHIQWSTDGSRILFTFGHPYLIDFYSVPQVHIVGSIQLEGQHSNETPRLAIVNTPDRDPIWGDFWWITFMDVSPDGSHIVLSICTPTEVSDLEIERLATEWHKNPFILTNNNSGDVPEERGAKNWAINHEIVVSDIGGTNVTRLTEKIRADIFPVWSPDGSKIVFVSEQLTIYTLATGRFEKVALRSGVAVHPYRLTWSPDGERIAFVGQEHFSHDSSWNPPDIYTIGIDGSELTKMSDAASGLTWSSDGRRVAAVVPSGEGELDYGPDGNQYPRVDVNLALYTFAADGSDPILVNSNLPEPWYDPVEPWLGDLSWSPDGSEILLKGFGHRVPLDGSPSADVGPGFINPPYYPRDASWSPDGSMITYFDHDKENPGLLFIADRNGKNVRTLLDYADIERELSRIDWDKASQ